MFFDILGRCTCGPDSKPPEPIFIFVSALSAQMCFSKIQKVFTLGPSHADKLSQNSSRWWPHKYLEFVELLPTVLNPSLFPNRFGTDLVAKKVLPEFIQTSTSKLHIYMHINRYLYIYLSIVDRLHLFRFVFSINWTISISKQWLC